MKKGVIFSLLFGLVFAFSCKNQNTSVSMEAGFRRISGKTMGTTYNIIYLDKGGRNFRISVDSLLNVLDNELSTYNKQSFISRFNQSSEAVPVVSEKGMPIANHFYNNFIRAKEIFSLTKGAFDPTVMPLVNYWGFGYKDTIPASVDTLAVDSILTHFVGFDKVTLFEKDNTKFIKKKNKNIEIDFNSLAKGYGVDAVSELLQHFGVKNYMVEIGGEVRVKGKNDKGKLWSIGINTPKEGAPVGEYQAIAELDNIALATSGNYRNFYIVDSMVFSHTISPNTGFPERSSLLSASIFAPDCISADAMATACMVMGLPECAELIESQDGMEGYFIFGGKNGTLKVIMTSGTPDFLRN